MKWKFCERDKSSAWDVLGACLRARERSRASHWNPCILTQHNIDHREKDWEEIDLGLERRWWLPPSYWVQDKERPPLMKSLVNYFVLFRVWHWMILRRLARIIKYKWYSPLDNRNRSNHVQNRPSDNITRGLTSWRQLVQNLQLAEKACMIEIETGEFLARVEWNSKVKNNVLQ